MRKITFLLFIFSMTFCFAQEPVIEIRSSVTDCDHCLMELTYQHSLAGNKKYPAPNNVFSWKDSVYIYRTDGPPALFQITISDTTSNKKMFIRFKSPIISAGLHFMNLQEIPFDPGYFEIAVKESRSNEFEPIDNYKRSAIPFQKRMLKFTIDDEIEKQLKEN